MGHTITQTENPPIFLMDKIRFQNIILLGIVMKFKVGGGRLPLHSKDVFASNYIS